ncbi:protein ORANGE-ORANGE, chloroplastic-like isoform X1 [Pyrus communis]|uniref:protein ORANGE-ORANGE, chloroplastic-like isoform X1 n=1 Tax=Pyrus communis TaxID=23211 RepID=UPI0035BF6FEE
MLCSSRLLAIYFPVNRCSPYELHSAGCSKFSYPRSPISTGSSRWRSLAMASEPDSSSFAPSVDSDPNPAADTNPAGFCIIEGPETVQDFATTELQEIQDNIRSWLNKIFLHMEEVRRLRIRQRIKRAELGEVNEDQENELPIFPSFIPFLPPLSSDNLKLYYAFCYSIIAGFILFGGLIAPSLELKLVIGGTSYKDFIANMHLPLQLSQLDPIVASFSGGAVGVISALMDILLVLVAPALEPLFLPNQFQQLMAETSPFHCQKLKDVQIAQERER